MLAKGFNEFGNGRHSFWSIVEARHNGRTHKNGLVRVFLAQCFQIAYDVLVGKTCHFLVLGTVHALDVKEHVVQVFACLKQHALLAHATGFHCRADEAGPCLAQECQGKLALQKRLSTGKGHATAASGVKGRVLLHNLHDLVYGLQLAVDIEALGRTGIGAGKVRTVLAQLAPDGDLGAIAIDSAPWTGIHAEVALVRSYAAVVVHCHLGKGLLRFGVAAPSAAQMAALQKGNCSDARAIVDRVFLYVEDIAGGLFVLYSAHCRASLWQEPL